jgi:hypothetical protein
MEENTLMPCSVFVYASPRSALSTPIVDLIANAASTILARVSSTRMGPKEYGNDLTFAAGAFVYTITVHDPSGIYGPLVVPAQNGQLSNRHDLVLKKLPPAGAMSGIAAVPRPGGRASFADISGHIEGRSDWDDEEKEGVRRLVAALAELSQVKDLEIGDMLSLWADWLTERGIAPKSIFRVTPARVMGS